MHSAGQAVWEVKSVSKHDARPEGSAERIERREFIRRLLVGAIGVPTAAAALLSGCDGNGLLDNQPAGNLTAEVADMRALQTQVINTIQQLDEAADADITDWLAQINAQLAVVWPLMVAASRQQLRDNVADDMQPVLGQLDQLGLNPAFAGDAPQITRQQFQDAWDRAHQLAGATPTAVPAQQDNRPYLLWAYLFMLLILFPSMADDDAATYAANAADRDTSSRALGLWDLFHIGSVSCTPCLFSQIISTVVGLYLILYLYLGMACHAAGAPGLLFGRDWLVMLVMIAALLLLNFA